MKYTFTCLCMLIIVSLTSESYSQNKSHSIFVKGKIVENDIGLSGWEVIGFPSSGVVVNLTVNSLKEKNYSSDNNGNYSFSLDPGKEYILEYTKPGYVTKRIYVSTKEVTQDEIKFGMFPLVIDIQLFEDFPGLNTDILKKPISKFTFSDYEGDFVDDEPYYLTMKVEVDKVNNQLQQLKKQAYDKEVASADNLFSHQKLEDAWIDYEKALKTLPLEKYPVNQITEIKRLINEKMTLDEAYQRTIERADKHYGKKNIKTLWGSTANLYYTNQKKNIRRTKLMR